MKGWGNNSLAWENGALNGTNSAYNEGNVVPVRWAVNDDRGQTRSVALQYDFLDAAYFSDFLTTYTATETSVVGHGCDGFVCPSAFITASLPVDPSLPSGGQIPGYIVGYNVVSLTVGSVFTVTSVPTVRAITVTYKVTGTLASGSADVVLLFGGHLARENEWGYQKGASNFPGGSGRWISDSSFEGVNREATLNPGTAVVRVADLAITKSDTPDPVLAGGTLTYTLSVVNNGPNRARTFVTDTLPAGLTFIAGSGSVASPASGLLTCGATGQEVRCPSGSATFDIDAGSTAAFTITTSVGVALTEGTRLTNTARLTVTAASSLAQYDEIVGNNVATATTTIQRRADLGITKTDGQTTASPGGIICIPNLLSGQK